MSAQRAASGSTAGADFHSAHRRDIDGLRAVAILSVLGYHANSNWLPGGFVGVDIFFVLSGYLISGIIFNGLQQSRFSFADFYARRIKRIFPALLLVLVAVCLFGWFALFTDEYRMLGAHLAAGAGFVSNIVLWREAGYFDPAADLKPLLHLWSLGIEEQFYLFWPPLLYLLWLRRIKPLPVIIAITIGSFALNAYWVSAHEVRTFYLPATRLWELSLGGALACIHVNDRDAYARWSARLGVAGARLMAASGLALLIVSVCLLSKHQLFPGWRATLPTIGTLLLIAAGPRTWINRNLLGNPLMVFVGLISYPLYLWHWPLLSFQRIVTGAELSTTTLLTTMALAVALAWLTYRFIERPIRTSRFRLQPSLALASGATLVGIVGYLGFAQIIQPRSSQYGLEQIIGASAQFAFPGPHLRVLPALGPSGNPPVRMQGISPQTVLFLGDSEVEQYYPRIDWLLSNHPSQTKSVIYSSNGGCPPLPFVHENHLPECNGLIERGIALARSPNVDTVVLAADWMGYFNGPSVPEIFDYYYDDGTIRGDIEHTLGSEASDRAFAALESMIEGFIREGKRVYIVLPMPTGPIFRPRSMIPRSLTNLSFRVSVPDIRTTAVVSHMHPVVERLVQIAARTGALVVDPVAALCRDSVCPVLTADGEPVYRDGGHLNPQYVRQNVGFLDDLVRSKGTRLASTGGG